MKLLIVSIKQFHSSKKEEIPMSHRLLVTAAIAMVLVTAAPVSAATSVAPSPPPPPVIVTGCTTTTTTPNPAKSGILSGLVGSIMGRASSPTVQSLSGSASQAAGSAVSGSTTALTIGLQSTTASEIKSVRLVLSGTTKIDTTKPIDPRDFVSVPATGSCQGLPVVIRVEFTDGTFWFPVFRQQ
jgi:hypothetical protein